MAITDYSGLSTAVYRRLNRSAESTVFIDALALTEAEINRRLALNPVRPMHMVATATIDSEYIGDPDDILDIDSFQIGDDVVEATSAQNMANMFERDNTEAKPQFYAQIGAEFRLYPSPDATYTAKIIYWAKLPALTSIATTNWLSLAHPDVYFHGVLAHLAQEYFDEDTASTQAGLFDVALEKVLSAYPTRTDKAPIRMDDMPVIRRGYEVLA